MQVRVLAATLREALLMDWLSELIFRADARKKVYTDFNV